MGYLSAPMAEDETTTPRGSPPPRVPKGLAPARQKKKKKKASALRPDGAERPRFLLKFPRHPELDRLVAAFEAGDYATVRRDAPKLVDSDEDAAVRDAALELERRIEPDPLMKYLLLASVVLLVFLILQSYFGHAH